MEGEHTLRDLDILRDANEVVDRLVDDLSLLVLDGLPLLVLTQRKDVWVVGRLLRQMFCELGTTRQAAAIRRPFLEAVRSVADVDRRAEDRDDSAVEDLLCDRPTVVLEA